MAATGVYQYFVIEGQLRVALQDERAWLQMQLLSNAPGGNTTVQLNPGQQLNVPLRLTNTGKTPAKRVKATIYTSIADIGLEAPLEYVDDGKLHPRNTVTTGILYPNQEIQVPAIRSGDDAKPRPTTDDEVKAVKEGKMYLVVFGIVEYDDVFKMHHWAKFCLWNAAEGTGLIQVKAFRCTQFNSVDD